MPPAHAPCTRPGMPARTSNLPRPAPATRDQGPTPRHQLDPHPPAALRDQASEAYIPHHPRMPPPWRRFSPTRFIRRHRHRCAWSASAGRQINAFRYGKTCITATSCRWPPAALGGPTRQAEPATSARGRRLVCQLRPGSPCPRLKQEVEMGASSMDDFSHVPLRFPPYPWPPFTSIDVAANSLAGPGLGRRTHRARRVRGRQQHRH